MEVIGNYECSTKDQLGHGAFAIVYKGQVRQKPDCPVAIKCMKRSNLPKNRRMIMEEINILKDLTKHSQKHVVRLIDCAEDINHVYLVMEYCNGGDLLEYLTIRNRLPESTIQIFVVQLADAMKSLLALGVVHRDLKPKNILLSHKNGDTMPPPSQICLKVTDFGLSRFLDEGRMAATMCGSPLYMAPEIHAGKPYDARADLWSLGVLIFRCLTGSEPFRASTPLELGMMYERCMKLVPSIPASTSPDLTDLLLGLLRRSPQHRILFEDFLDHPFLTETIKERSFLSVSCGIALLPAVHPQVTAPRAESPVLEMNSQGALLLADACHGSSIESTHSASARTNRATETDTGAVQESTDDGFVFVSHIIGPVLVEESTNNRFGELPPLVPKPVTQLRRRHEYDEPNQSHAIVVEQSVYPSSYNFRCITPPPSQFLMDIQPYGKRRRCSTAGSTSGSTQYSIDARYQSEVGTMNAIAPNHRQMLRIEYSAFPFGRRFPESINFGFVREIALPEVCGGPIVIGCLAAQHYDDQVVDTARPSDMTLETLLDRDHNAALNKLKYMLALTDSILQVADSRHSPLSMFLLAPPDASLTAQVGLAKFDQAKRLVLLLHVLDLLRLGLELSEEQLILNVLKPSKAVIKVIKSINDKFKAVLSESKKYLNAGIGRKDVPDGVTADQLLYDYALVMCNMGCVDEYSGNIDACMLRYQTAQILLHFLGYKFQNQVNRWNAKQFKTECRKRLQNLLQQQGVKFEC